MQKACECVGNVIIYCMLMHTAAWVWYNITVKRRQHESDAVQNQERSNVPARTPSDTSLTLRILMLLFNG